MIFTIDSGNTFFKVAGFEQQQLVLFKEQLTYQETAILCQKYSPEQLILCDVAKKASPFLETLQAINPTLAAKVTHFNYLTPIPIQNLYATPHTLGMDRLATAIGAWATYPHQNCLIIDAGSCITYDLLNDKGQYEGGSISLGLLMRYKALQYFTAGLPLLNAIPSEVPLIGKNTQTAIQSGVQNGLLLEVQGVIKAYQTQYDNLHILLCGGDANFLHKNIPQSIATEVHQTLLHEGLLAIKFF